MKKEMICISCPLGCAMSAEYEAGSSGGTNPDTIKVSGESCPRGLIYAKNELIAPKRVFTTTLKLKGGGTVSVKTAMPIPKEDIFTVLAKLKGVEITPPVRIGQSLVKGVSAGVDIVSTQELS